MMVSSAKVKVGMKVILGLSYQLIQMGLSGFNAEENLNNSTYEALYIFPIIKLKRL